MVENVERVQVLLGKAKVANSPNQYMLNLSEVWKEAMEAQSDLTNLPISHRILMRTSRYLNQTGDYAYSLARKNAEGRGLSTEEINQLEDLQTQAVELTESLHEVEREVMDGNINWREMVNRTGYQISDDELQGIENQFDGIRENLDQYPALIYDGPFSAHIGEGEPRGLTGEEVSRGEAEEKAREALDEDDENLELIHDEMVSGRFRAYSFRFENDNVRYCVDISEKGGHLVNLVGSQNVENNDLNLEQVYDHAQEYLAEIGYENMVPTSGESRGNIAYVSLAYEEDDIIYYPDTIVVQVSQADGQIIGVEASKYLYSHHDREVQEPEISEDEVEDFVQLDNIDNIRQALIPTEFEEEIFTYEVEGSIGEGDERERYLIYVNAENGIEEEIFHIIDTERGKIVI